MLSIKFMTYKLTMNLHIVAEYGINFVLFDNEKPSAFLFQITNKVYNEKHATKTYFISVHLYKYDHKNFCTSEIGIGWIYGLCGTEVEVE